jgi:hypothetical protein
VISAPQGGRGFSAPTFFHVQHFSLSVFKYFKPMIRLLFALLCMTATLSASAADPATGLEGVITAGPVHGGPTRIGVPDSRPLANTAFIAENQKGTVISFSTDDQGRFHLSLEPGHYTVSLKEKRGGIGRYGPFEVDVVAGQMTKVEWRCDTGMR